MKIKTKYNPGENVYLTSLERIPYEVDCKMCQAEGLIFNKNGDSFTCPTCEGKKKMGAGGGLKNKPKKKVISSIKITVFADLDMDILYTFVDGERFEESRIFPDLESAQKHCDEENSKGVMGYF